MISVIIPCYNAENFIGEAIESVLRQTFKPYEIIVVDDGSTDDSVKVIKKFKDKIILIQQENKGRVEARKTGFRRATGKWIALLDADDYWHPKKLELQINYINHNFKHDMVLVHGRDEWVGKVENYTDYYIPDRPPIMNFQFLFYRMLIATSSVLLRKDILDSVINFWNLGRLRAQDYGLYLLMLCHGNAYYINEVVSFYRVHDSNLHDKLSFAIGRYYARQNVLSYIAHRKLLSILSFDWKSIMAQNCLEIAWLYYARTDYKNARKFIAESFKYKVPFNKWLLLYCFLFLPKRTVTSIRKLLGSQSLKTGVEK